MDSSPLALDRGPATVEAEPPSFGHCLWLQGQGSEPRLLAPMLVRAWTQGWRGHSSSQQSQGDMAAFSEPRALLTLAVPLGID